MIVESEEDSYFVDSIDDMKWNTKFTWFEFLIKWEEYEQKTWELYMMIKKDALILIKEFHENHFSQSASAEWIKEENWWLSSNTQFMKWIMNTQFMKTEKAWSIVDHELDFDHDQNHVRNHDVKYEISEISDVVRDTVTRLHSLVAWRSWWNSQSVLDHSQEQTCEFQKNFSEQLKVMSMISIKLIRMIKLAYCLETTSYFWMLLFFLFVRLACLL